MIPQSLQLLERAEKALRTADHMIYITYPLIKDNRLLKNVLEQLYEITDNVVYAVLHYEAAYKRISPFTISPLTARSQNWLLFSKCSSRFSITSQELEKIKELLEVVLKHKESSIEFTRKDRLVFMNNTRAESVGLEQMKSYLNALKITTRKTKEKIAEPVWQQNR